MERRHLLLAGLAGLFAGGARARARAALPPAAPDAAGNRAQPVQYRPPPGRRRPRCWIERQRVRFRDRFGRLRLRWVDRRVCR
ncbi:hypothetical protein [Falsiroseomonas selenitidurans]|uniref:Uncharacterized protein n=1 Tax=Falsiroseomonas selenitidurans TaxID=2716335 RepID=A0ABX1DYR2_9PROT|nr:hypothetical protein [Falsiroseomonas selenitidurans]NKC30024.1 hypothetical protein [Falsiroseomonas selenitidurans]